MPAAKALSGYKPLPSNGFALPLLPQRHPLTVVRRQEREYHLLCATCYRIVLSQVHRGMARDSSEPSADGGRNHVPDDPGHTLYPRAVPVVDHTGGEGPAAFHCEATIISLTASREMSHVCAD